LATLEIGTLHDEIRALAQERDAVIIAHNYQRPEVQDVADYVGDSLGLSRLAATTDAEVIVFCGVHFMAETAAILSPDKTVLLPDLGAGCSLAASITGDQLREWKALHPGVRRREPGDGVRQRANADPLDGEDGRLRATLSEAAVPRRHRDRHLAPAREGSARQAVRARARRRGVPLHEGDDAGQGAGLVAR